MAAPHTMPFSPAMPKEALAGEKGQKSGERRIAGVRRIRGSLGRTMCIKSRPR